LRTPVRKAQDGVDEVLNDVQLRACAEAQVGRPAVDRAADAAEANIAVDEFELC